jgi:hypothetical protein
VFFINCLFSFFDIYQNCFKVLSLLEIKKMYGRQRAVRMNPYCRQCKGINADGKTRCRKTVCKESADYCFIHYTQGGNQSLYNCPKCMHKYPDGRQCQRPVCNQSPVYCSTHFAEHIGRAYVPKHPYRGRNYGRNYGAIKNSPSKYKYGFGLDDVNM